MRGTVARARGSGRGRGDFYGSSRPADGSQPAPNGNPGTRTIKSDGGLLGVRQQGNPRPDLPRRNTTELPEPNCLPHARSDASDHPKPASPVAAQTDAWTGTAASNTIYVDKTNGWYSQHVERRDTHQKDRFSRTKRSTQEAVGLPGINLRSSELVHNKTGPSQQTRANPSAHTFRVQPPMFSSSKSRRDDPAFRQWVSDVSRKNDKDAPVASLTESVPASSGDEGLRFAAYTDADTSATDITALNHTGTD